MTDPREEKLPKWVQYELARLRRRNEDLTRTVSQLNGGVPAFGIVRGGWNREQDRPVMFDPYDTLTIVLGDGMHDPANLYRQRYIDIQRVDGRLLLRSSGSLHIEPWASNSVYIDSSN